MLLEGLDVVADVAVVVELARGARDAWPTEFREQAHLVGQGVGHRKGVPRTTVEGVLEVDDHEVVHIFVEAGSTQLAGLPVEGGLQAVLDRQRTTSNPEVVVKTFGAHVGGKRIHERSHVRAVEVAVRRVGLGDLQEFFLKAGFVEARVVVAQRPRGVAGEAVKELVAAAGVVDPRSSRLVQVEHDVHAVGELVLLQDLVDVGGLDGGHGELRGPSADGWGQRFGGQEQVVAPTEGQIDIVWGVGRIPASP